MRTAATIVINTVASALAVTLVAAGCSSPPGPSPAGLPALVYAKDGALYISGPAGAPGRKITDGPADSEPAPSPDGSRIAFVRGGDPPALPGESGGELWVLDLSRARRPAGAPRRLVDPAALVPRFDNEGPGRAVVPRWSPAGDQVAFLKSAGGGGILLVADVRTGALTVPPQPLYADDGYAWSPDGSQIAWVDGRSDVSPVGVNVLTVGGTSAPVAEDTNAFAVGYDADGRAVLFANGDATGSDFAAIPFALRDGGIYAVDPPNGPAPLLTGTGSYDDVAGLPDGAVAFTEWSSDQRTKTIRVLRKPQQPPQTLAETLTDAPPPAWTGPQLRGAENAYVAYVGTGPGRPLLVTDLDGMTTPVAEGADAFAWLP